MKNSATTSANTVASTTAKLPATPKQKAQSMTIATIKAVVCVPHIVLQGSANLLMIGEAKLIKAVDGTPMFESIEHRSNYTQEKMDKMANFVIDQQAKVQARLDAIRRQDIAKVDTEIAKLTAKKDVLEGVEHITPVATVEPTVPTVPAPPVTEAPFVPINKRGPKTTPVMTAPAV